MVSSSQHLGPMVHTILVFRDMGWSFMIMAGEMEVERMEITFASLAKASGGMMLSGWYSGVQNRDADASSSTPSAARLARSVGMAGRAGGGPTPAPVNTPLAMNGV